MTASDVKNSFVVEATVNTVYSQAVHEDFISVKEL